MYVSVARELPSAAEVASAPSLFVLTVVSGDFVFDVCGFQNKIVLKYHKSLIPFDEVDT
jgi:hypothetical protein